MVEVSFGEWLKRQRNGRGLTQEQLAHQVSCSTITLRKIEAEERRPSAQIIERLAKIFNIPPNEQSAFLRFARGDWKSAPSAESEDAPWRPPTPAVAKRSNLPASITSLVGREQDIANVHEYLLNPDIRLVTLIGPPGIGKTRLSLEVAHTELSNFPDGVFFAALAPLEDPSLVAPTIVQALGFVETKNQPPVERLKDGIGNKQMLIVLDNVEHLIEGIATLVSDLLSACPRLKILTTSREALRVPGEWLYPVPALNTPGETQLQSMHMDELSKYTALTLFAARARTMRSDFTLNTDNIQAVTTICIQLDGLPLAIELISSGIRLMSAQALLAKLNDQFVLSANGMRAVAARQKTLQNAIGWSYNLLSPEEQKLFARLSIFAGGFTLDAAETIFFRTVTKKSISDLIASLLDKSLLQRTFDERGESRFTMLVTIQQFALDRLQSMGEESEARDWHFDYYLNLAEAGESHMYGHGQLEWLGHLQAELDNFRGAFEWNLAQQTNVEKSLRLAIALGSFWRIRSDFHEAQHWLEIVLSLDEAEHYSNAYAKALLIMGIIKLMSVSPEVGEPLLSQSVMIARRLDDNHILGEALDYLGLALAFQKKYDQAHTLLEESQMLFHAANDKKGIALTKWHLGWILEDEGNQTTGFELIKQALTLLEELGDIHRQSILLRSIGWHLLEAGDFKQGNATLRRALSAAYKVGSKLEVGNTFMDLAFVEEQQSNFAKSVQLLWTAQKLYLACGAQDHIPDFEQKLDRFRAHLDQGTFEAAVTQAQTRTIEQAISYALENSNE